MKPLLTKNLKVKFLGITPVLKDETGFLNPQEIVALSSLATFKGKSIKNLIKDIEKKGENVKERIKGILQKSSLRGHASVATTPTLCLTYEGSKFLDWALTGLVFSSSLVSSGRRTDTTEKDIIFPQAIYRNAKARKIYHQVSKENINLHNYFLSKGVSKDEARKILQQGIYGTGIIQLPIESIISIKKEYELEKDWMPEEIGIFLKNIENSSKELGIDLLYSTRLLAPRNTYPYPNVFKNPAKTNIVRDLREKEKLSEGFKIITADILRVDGLKKKMAFLGRKSEDVFSSLNKIKKEYPNLLFLYQELIRDYNSALRLKILSSIPMGVWTEKKRHRTIPMVVESLYFCIERAVKVFNKFEEQLKNKKINKNAVKEIEQVISIPPSIKSNHEFLLKYLLSALESFQGYRNVIRLKIKPRDAAFLIPRGVKIDVLQEFDLYNLISGYYPLRLCTTADEEMRRNTIKEVLQIKKTLTEKGCGWLNKFIVPKCQIVGFCPEEKTCPMIKSLIPNYDEKFHHEMKQDLEDKFQKYLRHLGK